MKGALRIALVLFLCEDLTQTALGQDEVQSRWIHLLESDDPAVRRSAVESTREIGPDAADLLSQLQKMAKSDPAPEVQVEAVRRLVDIDGAHKGNLEVFLQILCDDEDLSVRLAAAHAIQSTERSDDEIVVALNALAKDLAADADFSIELKKWVWWIGWTILLAILVIAVIGVIRYIVFRDLRRTLITAALALAFLPQVGVTILTLIVEYWLYGEKRGPGMVAMVGAMTSAAVIVFAMFFIDRQDSRRQPAISAPENEWGILSEGIEKFCGIKLTPREFILRLVRNFSIPQKIVSPKNWDEGCCEAINVAVRDTMLKLMSSDLSEDEAVSLLIKAAKPRRLGRYEAIQLITCAKHYLMDL